MDIRESIFMALSNKLDPRFIETGNKLPAKYGIAYMNIDGYIQKRWCDNVGEVKGDLRLLLNRDNVVDIVLTNNLGMVMWSTSYGINASVKIPKELKEYIEKELKYAQEVMIMEITIKIFPDIGDTYKIILFIPQDVDTEEYVDRFLDDHAINVAEWMLI